MEEGDNPGQPLDMALIEALLDGAFESPPWSTFLDRLRAVTGADFVILHFQPPGRPIQDALDLISGNVPVSAILEVDHAYFQPGELSAGLQLAEGRPYRLDELMALNESLAGPFRSFLADQGVIGLRQMRVREASGIDAGLTIVRRERDFSARDDALLRAVSPVLRGVLRHYVALERERFVSSLASETAYRLQFGWLALDTAGQVLDWDEQGARILEESGVLGKSADGRLTATPPGLQREIHAGLSRVAANPGGRARAITLRRDPWLDMLLVPTSRRSISTATSPAVIAYVHGDSWHAADCCEQLAELFALTPSEARLALAVCRGMTIAEAAAELGISVGTARTYSKSIYAKTGARGLPDLVRIVMRSVLALAPGP